MYWIPDPEHPLTKVCSKCREEKHLMEFHVRYSSGRRRADCKACCRAAMRRYYATHGPQCRARMRRRRAADPVGRRERVKASRHLYRERKRRHDRLYRRRYPERTLVRWTSWSLRKLGLLAVADCCTDCGGGPVELHHPDYGDPFTVVPLCRPCHWRRHLAVWRRVGGGPVKYPEEYRDAAGAEEEACRMSNAERRMSNED